MNYERIVTMNAAYDKRHKDPNKNYGIHGVDLRMVLKGEKGATQFVLYTGWHLPHVQKELIKKEFANPSLLGIEMLAEPLPADLGYHSPTPQFEGQSNMGDCDILEGGDCYYDGSSLNAERMYKILLKANIRALL